MIKLLWRGRWGTGGGAAQDTCGQVVAWQGVVIALLDPVIALLVLVIAVACCPPADSKGTVWFLALTGLELDSLL